MTNDTSQQRLSQIDDEISRHDRDYAARDAYGDAGPKLQQLLKAIALLRRERDALTKTERK